MGYTKSSINCFSIFEYIISILYGDILKIFLKIYEVKIFIIKFYEKLNNWTHFYNKNFIK